jgi:hypothetical protein
MRIHAVNHDSIIAYYFRVYLSRVLRCIPYTHDRLSNIIYTISSVSSTFQQTHQPDNSRTGLLLNFSYDTIGEASQRLERAS